MGAKIDTIKNEVAQQVGSSLRDMDEAIQARFDHIESRAGQDRTRIGVLERHAQMGEKRMQKLEREVALTKSMDMDLDSMDTAWTRPPC